MKDRLPTDIAELPPTGTTMIQRIEQLKAIHNAFFQNDESNLKAMMAGFTMSAVAILMIVGLFQL